MLVVELTGALASIHGKKYDDRAKLCSISRKCHETQVEKRTKVDQNRESLINRAAQKEGVRELEALSNCMFNGLEPMSTVGKKYVYCVECMIIMMMINWLKKVVILCR